MTSATNQPDFERLRQARGRLRGALLLPGDDDYAIGRRLWNGWIERSPAAIAVCADAEDVAHALRIATDVGLPVTVRGGGHNIAGRSVADGALMVDLSRLRGVVVRADTAHAIVQGGALWHEVDLAAAEVGLATTGGLISSTGVGGFTLGGGCGWLMRRFGLAADNLVAARVILPDGRQVRASADDHPDLFWALRGGGGLGVVTEFEFRMYPVTRVVAGLLVRPPNEAADALRAFRDFAANAPDEFCGMAVLAHAPPLPFLDPAWHGRPALLQLVCWSGAPEAADRVLAPLRRFGKPLVDHIGTMPYVQWQHINDGAAPPGRHHYWKTASFRELPDGAIDDLATALPDLPTPFTEIHVQHLGGAVARVPADETAFAQRDTAFFVNIIGTTVWPDDRSLLRDRVRALHERLARQARSERLPNFTGPDDAGLADQLTLDATQRLRELRKRYDPHGRIVSA